MSIELVLKLILISLLISACNSSSESNTKQTIQSKGEQIICTDAYCSGVYTGKEFINGSDIAHQFSNTMSTVVGNKLKELYDSKMYSKVDFSNIEMSTEGMGSGRVEYKLKIPFIRVPIKCDSYTSFDHVGGWNHAPELEKRKNQLSGALLKGDSLDISPLLKTKEGLEEHWIQWRNKEKQNDCL